jgi:hypothetical protein
MVYLAVSIDNEFVLDKEYVALPKFFQEMGFLLPEAF